MTEDFILENRLGFRMLRWVLAVAIISGIMLSVLQILTDARQVSTELDRHGLQTLALIRDPATQAIFNLDEELAGQVLEGLFQLEALTSASIRHPNGESLATRSGELADTSYRPLTDFFFGATRTYSISLNRIMDTEREQFIDYGELTLVYDTFPGANNWLERSAVTLVVGIARALLAAFAVFLLIHWLLTRPLQRIVRSLTRVDPAHPDRYLLERPPGHQGDELDLYVRATNRLLVAIEDSRKRQEDAEARANRLTRYDRLTGLPTRETILSNLSTSITECLKSGERLAVYCCGIDDFKSINEQLGYRTGDQILQTIAERLQEPLSNTRIMAGRLNSDQFVVIASPVEDEYEAAEVAESLLSRFNEKMLLGESTIRITTTIGIAIYPTDTDDPDRLLQHAEHTMTLAKAESSNRIRFFIASVDQEIRTRKQLERDLAQALPEKQFHLVYQPQISLQSGRIVGAEALLRWNHPERGLIPPDDFIPLAELNGSIVEIGHWVLNEACRQAAACASSGLPIRIAVNLSAVQLRQPDIVGTILDTLGRHQIPPGRLELEITETGFMENLEDAVNKLRQLNGAGINIAVDDFGTGYSSLTYLKKMPLQHLKIDKQFVQDLLVNEDDTRIANTIIDLGRSLNLSVIAEGVETPEQEFYLRQRGCQMAQGYYFSRPLPPEELFSFVADFHGKLEENMENAEDNRD